MPNIPVKLLLLAATCPALAAPTHLRTNSRDNPLGIDTPTPTFSWQSDATARNWTQSAYQILVATSAAALQTKPDIWDSGRQPSAHSVDIPYAGPALASRRRYVWTVRTWDAAGHMESAPQPAVYEMGLLIPSDWHAEWITPQDSDQTAALAQIQWIWLPASDPRHVTPGTQADFRYTLHLDTLPADASLHLRFPGTFTASVNGIQTGHKNQWEVFDFEDIRPQLHAGSGSAGDNLIQVHVQVPIPRRPAPNSFYALAGTIRLTDPDGTVRYLPTDAHWQAAALSSTPGTPTQPVPATALAPITSSDPTLPPAPTRILAAASLLRTDFTAPEPIASARLYITALGSYQAYLNGHRIGDAVLAPGFTDFRKRVLYQTYDVTPLLRSGPNTLAAELAPGWHSSPLFNLGAQRFPGPDRLRAQLEITYRNGATQLIASGPAWTSTHSPTLYSEIYGGEAFDARLQQPGWSSPNFHPTRPWQPATLVAADPAIAVTAQPDLPIHLAQTLNPITVKQLPSHDAVYDLGQNMVGTVRLHLQGPRGTLIQLRFAERLNPDGSIYTENLRNADATDTYILSGQGTEDWTPAFTFHGFRYVQVSGLPSVPKLEILQGQVLNSLPPQPSIRLQSGSPLLNRMNDLGLWGQRGNFVSIPTDCPQRDERMGWMGDAGAFWRTGSYNFDIDAFSSKFMQDVADAQTPAGAFTDIAPNVFDLDAVGAPGWADAGVLVPYATWLQYGDLDLVRREWPAMQREMDFILTTKPNFLRTEKLGNNYADWLAPDPHTPADLAATAYWALIAQQMQTMAHALGREEDSAKYATLYDHIRTAYQSKYLQPDGTVLGDTQTGYVLTLYANLAPEAARPALLQRLVSSIESHGNHLTTGFLGTPFLLSVLDTGGRTDLAYRLLLSTTYPSWGYMVDKGATTWWERWNGDTGDPGMNSYNHYAFGSVMAWVYRRAAGIDADPADPGFHHILIAPHPDPTLHHLHTAYDSAYGTIATNWTLTDHLTLTLTVPPNTSALISLPAATSTSVVRENAQTLPFIFRDGILRGELGSGTYHLEVLQP